MMYEGLVKRLRYAASYDERLVIEDCKEAADAIEELSAQCDNLHDALIGLDAVVPQTNLDRIRTADIDRVISWFCRGRLCSTCPYNGVECGIRDWLQKECE